MTGLMAGTGLAFVIALAVTVSQGQSVTPSTPAHASVARQIDSQPRENRPVSRDSYVGDETCGSCHPGKAQSFSRTAHHLTSRQASAASIAGPFTSGANILKTSNPGLRFRMEAKSRRFYETAIFGIPPDTTSQTEPIDLVIGSGRKGQSYLYWKGDRLFQLPVSYWIDVGQWVSSPGYEDGMPISTDRLCLAASSAMVHTRSRSGDQ